MKLNEFADDFCLAQHLRYGQHEIGRRHAFAQFATHVDADDVRRQEVDWLAQHRGFRFDTADTPAHDAQAINHGRM